MSVKLDRLKSFLRDYVKAYRAKHDLAEETMVRLEFQGNDAMLYILCRPIEPLLIQEGYYWFNDVDLRECTVIDVQDSGLNNTYTIIEAYADAFRTTLQLRSEYIDLSIPPGDLPPPVAIAKGDLIVSDGTDDVRLPAGQDGDVLIADSSETLGLRWGDVPAGLQWKGEWSNTSTYVKNDIVRHKKQTFIAEKPSLTIEPPNAEHWNLFIQGGDLYIRDSSFMDGTPSVDMGIIEAVVPGRGYITKVGVSISNPRTAGNLRFRVTRNGVTFPTTMLDVYINETFTGIATAEVPAQTVDFQIPEGETIGLIVTSTNFEPLVNRIEAFLVFQYG